MTAPDTSRGLLEVAVDSIEDARAAYDTLLGTSDDGLFRTENCALGFRAAGAGVSPHRLLLAGADDPQVTRLLARRGLETETEPGDALLGTTILGCPDEPGIGFVDAVPTAPRDGFDITRLDHLVVGSTDRNGPVALFGAVLGFDFRLDQKIFDDLRQLFFRTEGFVVEVVVGHPDHPSDAPIGVWGAAWRTTDLESTRDRLLAAGMDVSEIRTGRKRGTEVCTVREPRLGLPTILIG